MKSWTTLFEMRCADVPAFTELGCCESQVNLHYTEQGKGPCMSIYTLRSVDWCPCMSCMSSLLPRIAERSQLAPPERDDPRRLRRAATHFPEVSVWGSRFPARAPQGCWRRVFGLFAVRPGAHAWLYKRRRERRRRLLARVRAKTRDRAPSGCEADRLEVLAACMQ